MGKIILESADFGNYYISEVKKRGRSIYVQTDHDFPSIASAFGWRIRSGCKCAHDGTDGTTTCPECKRPAGFFINKAREYLDAHIGKIILDPGYFDA
jgi:hypothetical protein